MKNKKLLIIIGIIIILLAIIINIIVFTSLGEEIRTYIAYKILTPKETIKIEEQENIKVTYTYSWVNEGFDIQVTDDEIIKFITQKISDKKLNNYSDQIGFAIMGDYKVDLGNNISLKFDSYDDDGFVIMETADKRFLTKIEPEILKKVIEIVDKKLAQNIEMFKTDVVTISKKNDKDIAIRKIEEKTAISYILERCKNIYAKQINYEPSILAPNYEIDFNNEVKIGIYEKQNKGWLWKNGIIYEAYGLNTFDTIIENAFDNIVEREKMFKTDKITLISPEKTIEVKDKNIIEKITTNLMYSTMGEPKWLETYDITEEYNTGIKLKLNDYEFLIPGNKTIGNRYIVSKDKKSKLCYPLQDIEQYIYELLGIENKKTSGIVSIAVPNDMPEVTNSQNNIINFE